MNLTRPMLAGFACSLGVVLASCQSAPSGYVTQQRTDFAAQLRQAQPEAIAALAGGESRFDGSELTVSLRGKPAAYRIYALPKPTTTPVRVVSVCACYGDARRVMPLLATVLDAQGQALLPLQELPSAGAGWNLPLHFSLRFEPPPEAVYMLVTLDPDQPYVSWGSDESIGNVDRVPLNVPAKIKYSRQGRLLFQF